MALYLSPGLPPLTKARQLHQARPLFNIKFAPSSGGHSRALPQHLFPGIQEQLSKMAPKRRTSQEENVQLGPATRCAGGTLLIFIL